METDAVASTTALEPSVAHERSAAPFTSEVDEEWAAGFLLKLKEDSQPTKESQEDTTASPLANLSLLCRTVTNEARMVSNDDEDEEGTDEEDDNLIEKEFSKDKTWESKIKIAQKVVESDPYGSNTNQEINIQTNKEYVWIKNKVFTFYPLFFGSQSEIPGDPAA